MDFTLQEAAKLTLQPGDLLVCEGGEIGRTAIWRGEMPDCSYQNHVHRLRAKADGVVPEFVMYWMQAAFLHLGLYGGVGNRTTIPNLSGARLKNLPFPVPPRPEQEGIVHVLSRLQQAVETEERRIAAFKELKAATMAKLFREGLRGEPLKQTEIAEIPESWELRTIAELGELITGTTPPTSRREFYDGSIPFISPADISSTRGVSTTVKTLTKNGLGVSRSLPMNAVLVVCIGSTIGKVGLSTEQPSCTNQQINAIVCKKDVVAEFVYWLMNWNAERIRSWSTPSPVPILSKGAFAKGRVALPSRKEEQEEIARILCAIDDGENVATQRLEMLRSTFSIILQLLMTGEIRVSQAALPQAESHAL